MGVFVCVEQYIGVVTTSLAPRFEATRIIAAAVSFHFENIVVDNSGI